MYNAKRLINKQYKNEIMSLINQMNLDERKYAFLLGCVITRILLAFIVKTIDPKHLKIVSVLAAGLAIGWIYLYVFKKRQHAFEAGGVTWWNRYRPIHASIYLLVAYFAYTKQQTKAFYMLLVDVIFGLMVWLHHHKYL